MRFNTLNRKVHSWAAVLIALPILVIIGSGLLLQVKKQLTWVQPAEQRGTGTTPVIDFAGILASVSTVSEHTVSSWDDINRLDVRPGKGIVKVWLQNGFEVQVDLGTGKVLQSEFRRSDLIETLHDGSWFGGDYTKLGLFLPSGIALFIMWLTGLWMFWLPFSVKRRRRQLAEQSASAAVTATGAPRG